MLGSRPCAYAIRWTAICKGPNGSAWWPTRRVLQPSRQRVIHLVPAQFVLERSQLGAVVDAQELDASHGRELFQMLARQLQAKAGVMRAASVDPRRRCGLKIRLRRP